MQMAIILKENEWAKQMIASRDLGKTPAETLRRIGRYYLDCGYTKKEVESKLESFLLQCEPDCPVQKRVDLVDYATKSATKYQAVDIDSIVITDNEMQQIDSLRGVHIRRLAFTLLCLTKYYDVARPGSDGWVSNGDAEIMSLANINTSKKRQAKMYSDLRDAGMIQFSKQVDNTSVKVLFCTDGDPILRVADFRNLGYQYLMYHGEPYFECANCGITVKYKDPKNRRRQKYCPDCAAKILTRQRVEAMMRYKSRHKTKNK